VVELDHYVRLIGRLDMALDDNRNAMDVEIQAVKQRFLAHEEELKAERAVLLAKCQLFVEMKRDELLKGRKSLKLNFGRIGFRKLGDKIDVPNRSTPEMEDLVLAIERAKEADPDRFGRVEITTAKWITKAQVTPLADPDLAVIGLTRVKGEDEFFAEPDRSKVLDVEIEDKEAGTAAA
jgi:phage host-nuclease inhibitor protein Gam